MNNDKKEHDIETNTDNALVFDFITESDVADEVGEQKVMSVEVDTHVGKLENWPDELKNVVMARTTKRGTRIYAGDITYNKETEIISFTVGVPVPEYVKNVEERNIGTTFPDLCWLLSEGTTAQNIEQVTTPWRDGAEFGDLTWILPSKFCDDVVEAMHIMNSWILEGNLYQAVIYGPKFS